MGALGKFGRSVLFAVALAATAAGYWKLLRLSFGQALSVEDLLFLRLLVPLFSLFCLWHDRRAIRASVGEPSLAGLLLLVPCLAVGWLGGQGQQVRFEIVGCLGTLLTLVWAFFGFRTMRAVIFPVGYLVFFLHFAAWFSRGDLLQQAMRASAAELVCSVMEGLGFAVSRQGPLVDLPGLRLTIDTAVRDFGIVAADSAFLLSAAFAFFTQPTNLRRIILVALNVPFVVVGNALFVGVEGTAKAILVLAACGILTAVASRLVTKGAGLCARS